MTPEQLRENSLVLYRNRPACVKRVDDKLDIILAEGESVKVRSKDVVLLHPGPLHSLAELMPLPGEVQTAWELLAGGETTLPELAELVYGAYTPATAWAAWQLLADGLYFQGTPTRVRACTPEEVAQKQTTRQAVAAERAAWEAFVMRARARQLSPGDDRYLKEVEALALGQVARSRVLSALGRDESPENAHALLLELGYWDETLNPYPRRLGLTVQAPLGAVPALPAEARVDLTALAAFAIDDEGTQVPDDALSLNGSRLWVHVADAAALAPPASPLDLEARARAASLHLPEGLVPMLPLEAVRLLGLGLTGISPALSIGLDLAADGQVVGIEIVPSHVRVTRLTYEAAEARLAQAPFDRLYDLAERNQARRRARGAILIDLPEVDVKVVHGQVHVRALPPLKSRTVVREAMLMAGEGVARWALEHGVPLPFATQEPSAGGEGSSLRLSDMVALRRFLKRSQYRNSPALHAGLGLTAYVQATSPLRRYLDLVVHQQLRAHLRGEPLLDTPGIVERIGSVQDILASVRQVEQFADRHWILVYLMGQPGWQGTGIVVDKRRVLIPELALEVQVHLPADTPLDSTVRLVLRSINLAHQETYWQVKA